MFPVHHYYVLTITQNAPASLTVAGAPAEQHNGDVAIPGTPTDQHYGEVTIPSMAHIDEHSLPLPPHSYTTPSVFWSRSPATKRVGPQGERTGGGAAGDPIPLAGMPARPGSPALCAGGTVRADMQCGPADIVEVVRLL